MSPAFLSSFFFFTHTAPTEIYTLSYTTLFRSPKNVGLGIAGVTAQEKASPTWTATVIQARDRKSTRLNSSHITISYAVFCLKKKNGKPLPRTAKHPLGDCVTA